MLVNRPNIRRLAETTVNRIAAGEVIERPAAAIKELVENSVDAGATRVDVTIAAGGTQLMRVTDNGCGMHKDDLTLSIERHATSKLADDDDLLNISHLGFRGEALPSIGAVSRLQITSRPNGGDAAWTIHVEGGRRTDPALAAHPTGTQVEVRDLFFATPARLKFMKSERAEQMAITDMLKRMAMAHPTVSFSLSAAPTLSEAPKSILQVEAAPLDDPLLTRLGQIVGRDFAENALAIDVTRDDIRLHGYVGLPTLNKRTAQSQYMFVNTRPVLDKLFRGAVRGGYQDVLAHDRHAVLALYLEIPSSFVDVNVHPAKSEVRFRDPGLVRGMIVSSLKQALADAGHRTSSTVSIAALGKARSDTSLQQNSLHFAPQQPHYTTYMPRANTSVVARGLSEAAESFQAPISETEYAGYSGRVEAVSDPYTEEQADPNRILPLGVARAQLHQTYIVAQSSDGIVLVDQHAAHERLTLERLKSQMREQGVSRQLLLLPEVVEMDPDAAQRLLDRAEDLATMGLAIESFGTGAVMVRETPALLGTTNIPGLLADLAEDMAAWDSTTALEDKIDHVVATMACHGSIRAGRPLTSEEMNALLRQMEATPLSGQCAHGRPTYIELKLSDIESLFGRKE